MPHFFRPTRRAGALTRHRRALIEALTAAERDDDRPANEEQLGDLLDMLAGHLDGRPELGQLYAGTRTFMLGDHALERDAAREQVRRVVLRDGEVIASVLERLEGAGHADAFRSAFASAIEGVVADVNTHVRTLFVGDCLLAEIMAFLITPLAAEGISFNAMPANARSPRLLGSVLDAMAEPDFDVVFFSPFSHARLPEISALLDPKRGLVSRRELRELVDSILSETQAMLDYLSERFECPVFVHNAALVQRGANPARIAAKGLLTFWPRALAGERINQWLSDYIEHRNLTTHRHLFLLDEAALAERHGRRALGRAIFYSEQQHAVELSRRLADQYVDRIATIGQLSKKKLVVCDLDNTLWDGVIGEGDVTHLEARQRPLARLRHEGGVILSIASKNDPRNVRFEGGLLGADDFVAPQIHWGPKEGSIGSIRDALNLQTKHMVFVDDRPDERELVSEVYPEVLVLDATDDATWRRMAIWAELKAGSSEVDRTRMYKEREARQAFVKPASADGVSMVDHATLERLKLSVEVGAATERDLRRVTELINRTNQWNVSAARTSFKEVRAWYDAADAHVLVARVSDRFGDMGTVCAAVVEDEGQGSTIRAFVLSCRVFGYGVETAMLARLTALAKTPLVGVYQPTKVNHLAKSMYLDHGFEADPELEGRFVFTGSPIDLPAHAKLVG